MKKRKEKVYTLELSKQEKKDLGFKYDYYLEDYVYEFPVYKSKADNKTSLSCKLIVNEKNNIVSYIVCDMNGDVYAPYHNRYYGKSAIIPAVDKNIRKEFIKLGVKESGR